MRHLTVRDLVVDAVAVHRLTHLVTQDVIADPVRERWVEAAYAGAGRCEQARANLDPGSVTPWADYALAEGDRAPKLAVLVSCKWCTSIWCALLAVLARRAVRPVWDPLARLLALSSAGTLLSGLEQD